MGSVATICVKIAFLAEGNPDVPVSSFPARLKRLPPFSPFPRFFLKGFFVLFPLRVWDGWFQQVHRKFRLEVRDHVLSQGSRKGP